MAESIEIKDGDALIMVDTQVDFCPGGALAVAEGDQVVPVLNRVQPLFRTVVATRDWHPHGHCSFREQGGPWPPHCVQGTPGAEYHPDLDLARVAVQVIKADTVEVESFDNFAGTPGLAAELRARGVTRVFVGGLATEYCVKNTVLGALQRGFEAVALTDAMRPVEVEAGDGERALRDMAEAGAVLTTSKALAG